MALGSTMALTMLRDSEMCQVLNTTPLALMPLACWQALARAACLC